MVNKLRILLVIFAAAISLGDWPSSSTYHLPYTGVCDIASCGEAFSVTRSMRFGYNGPLFQLYNGSTSLDIGQVNHVVDMSTWSSFCSGVPSNCVYGKIYGQVNGNVLVPATVNQGGTTTFPNCSGGTNWSCAAPFAIEPATGLPIFDAASSNATPPGVQIYYNGSLGSNDTASTGINAGGSSISQLFNGQNIASAFCCGVFMMAHLWNATPQQVGQDFGVAIRYGTSGVAGPCSSSTEYCLEIDWEGQTGCIPGNDVGNYGTVPVTALTAFLAYNSATNTVVGSVNNSQLFSNSPPAAFGNCSPGVVQVGKYIHLGGGGDLSQPAPVRMREGAFFNSALSSTQQTALYNNITNFYQGLTTYRGIGDIVSGAKAFYGLRAYNLATIGTAAINVQRASDSHTCDVLTVAGLQTSGLGNTASCSTGGDNGQNVTSFCNATTCNITKFYDQSGNGFHMAQATTANQAQLKFNCIGSIPCASFVSSTNFYSYPNCILSAGPAFMGFMAERLANFSTQQVIFTACANPGVAATGLNFNASTNSILCQWNASILLTVIGADSAWHSMQCYGATTGPNSQAVIDGTAQSFGNGITFMTGCVSANCATLGGFNGGNPLNGNFEEAYIYSGTITVAQMQALCQNDSLYWGTPFTMGTCQ